MSWLGRCSCLKPKKLAHRGSSTFIVQHLDPHGLLRTRSQALILRNTSCSVPSVRPFLLLVIFRFKVCAVVKELLEPTDLPICAPRT